MADVTHIYGNEIVDAAARQDIADLEATTNDLKEDLTAVESDVTDLKDGLSSVENNVLTANIRQALLQIAEKIAYIDEDGQDYYDDLYDALYPPAPPADLVSISAVYTQTKTIYNTDDLDKLKSDLVVTAHMSDSTTQTVTNYALSGTLTVGTSTITVSYDGKTTTFTVTVTAGLYPMTIAASDSGVGFGSVDATKNTMSPPYRSNTNKTRVYAYGANALGYEINPAKQYRISVTATEDTNLQMIIHEFNATAYTALQNVQAVPTGNKTASGWLNITPSTPYTYTPTQLINGEPPVCIWLAFKQKDDGGWANLGDSVFPITIEQL